MRKILVALLLGTVIIGLAVASAISTSDDAEMDLQIESLISMGDIVQEFDEQSVSIDSTSFFSTAKVDGVQNAFGIEAFLSVLKFGEQNAAVADVGTNFEIQMNAQDEAIFGAMDIFNQDAIQVTSILINDLSDQAKEIDQNDPVEGILNDPNQGAVVDTFIAEFSTTDHSLKIQTATVA